MSLGYSKHPGANGCLGHIKLCHIVWCKAACVKLTQRLKYCDRQPDTAASGRTIRDYFIFAKNTYIINKTAVNMAPFKEKMKPSAFNIRMKAKKNPDLYRGLKIILSSLWTTFLSHLLWLQYMKYKGQKMKELIWMKVMVANSLLLLELHKLIFQTSSIRNQKPSVKYQKWQALFKSQKTNAKLYVNNTGFTLHCQK